MPNRWMALVECLWWGGVSIQCANRRARQAGFFDVPRGQQQEIGMNRDRFEGNWMQLGGKVKEHWGRLTQSIVASPSCEPGCGSAEDLAGFAGRVKTIGTQLEASARDLSPDNKAQTKRSTAALCVLAYRCSPESAG